MEDDPEDGFNVEENYYAFLNIPKTVRSSTNKWNFTNFIEIKNRLCANVNTSIIQAITY